MWLFALLTGLCVIGVVEHDGFRKLDGIAYSFGAGMIVISDALTYKSRYFVIFYMFAFVFINANNVYVRIVGEVDDHILFPGGVRLQVVLRSTYVTILVLMFDAFVAILLYQQQDHFAFIRRRTVRQDALSDTIPTISIHRRQRSQCESNADPIGERWRNYCYKISCASGFAYMIMYIMDTLSVNHNALKHSLMPLEIASIIGVFVPHAVLWWGNVSTHMMKRYLQSVNMWVIMASVLLMALCNIIRPVEWSAPFNTAMYVMATIVVLFSDMIMRQWRRYVQLACALLVAANVYNIVYLYIFTNDLRGDTDDYDNTAFVIGRNPVYVTECKRLAYTNVVMLLSSALWHTLTDKTNDRCVFIRSPVRRSDIPTGVNILSSSTTSLNAPLVEQDNHVVL